MTDGPTIVDSKIPAPECPACGTAVEDPHTLTCSHCGAPFDRTGSTLVPTRRRRMPWLWLALIAGTGIRLAALPLSSPEYNLPFWHAYGWPADHVTYVQWARQATQPDKGLLSMYSVTPDRSFKMRLSYGEDYIDPGESAIANYPPLGIYVIWLQGLIHVQLDLQRTANTALARIVFGAAPLIGDVLLAAGMWFLCTAAFSRRVAAWTTGIIYMIPPVWLDSCWWGQTDSWVLAPMVWVVAAMVRRRWLTAGIVWGIGLSLKPHAILLSPVWLFVWLDGLRDLRSRGEAGASGRWTVRIVCAVLLGLAVLNLTALPFWLTSGAAWLRESYLRNLGDEQPFTTLKAFNIWYIDLLRTYDANSRTLMFGLAKDTWGKLLAFAGMIVCFAVVWRLRAGRSNRLILFAGLWLLAVVMLPTRVHERYILMCLPFLIIAATQSKRLWPGTCAVIVVACFQLTVYHWLPLSADSWTRKWIDDTIAYRNKALAQTPPEQRDQIPTRDEAIQMRFANFRREHAPFAPYEWALTIVGCLAAAHLFFAAARGSRRDSDDVGGPITPDAEPAAAPCPHTA